MDENLNNELNNDLGQISGFDSAVSKDLEHESTEEKNDGFYTKSGQDIIQDKPFSDVHSETKNEQPKSTQTNYGGYNSNNNYYSNPQNNFYQSNRKKVNRKKKHYGIGTVIVAAVLAAVVGAASSIGVLLYLNGNINYNIHNNPLNLIQFVLLAF